MKKLALLIVVVVLLGMGLGGLLFAFVTSVEHRTLYTSITVAEHLGFDLNDTVLTFGSNFPGQIQERTFVVQNFNEYSVAVTLIAEGDLAEYLSLSNSTFELLSGGSEKVMASVRLPKNVSYGTINGTIETILRRKF